jgi:hypothetical protein
MDNEPAALPFEGISLVSDPVHGYLSFVDSPAEGSGACERHLIDHPWVQRLRSIYQLQSARLVFPSAEHTRFSHSLGAMHVAGRFARHLYPSVSHRFSLPFFESLLRVSALLHDTGHGPFCHFFDEHVSKPRFGRSHEQMSQAIIRGPLRPVIEKIDRGVSGPFAPGERLSADWVAYLVGKGTGPNPVPAGFPLLSALKPLFSGIFTVDNLDYVLRDAYMCGVSVGPVDLERILYYTHFQKEKLAIHRSGLGVFEQFIHIRRYMYAQIYFHRTTRAFDLALKELMGETLSEILPEDPIDHLENYLPLTDQFLLEHVKTWPSSSHPKLARLGAGWAQFLLREKSWKLIYETVRTGTERTLQRVERTLPSEESIRKAARERGFSFGKAELTVDVASRDARPENPYQGGEGNLEVYDPLSGKVGRDLLVDMLEGIPVRQEIIRVFGKGLRDVSEAGRIVSEILSAPR